MPKLIPTDDPDVFYHINEYGNKVTTKFVRDDMPDGYWRKQLWDLCVEIARKQYIHTVVRWAWALSLRERYGIREREVA